MPRGDWAKGPQREEIIERIRAKKLGRTLTPEHKAKVVAALRRRDPEKWKASRAHLSPPMKGKGQWLTCKTCGKPFQTGLERHYARATYCTPECRLANPEYTGKGQPKPWQQGEKHHNWKGGITSENRSARTQMEYYVWQRAVFSRDGNTCQDCGFFSKKARRLHAHHVKAFAKYPELRYDVANGLTLCKECHIKPGRHKAK
jgi:hypothetical protein